MKIRYMGTAAAEGIPAMFCACDTCRRALAAGGKNVMTRSQALIDDDLVVDFAADTYMHFLQAGKTLAGLKYALITHSHGDHVSFDDLSMRADGLAYNKTVPKLTVYCNEAVETLIREGGISTDRINPANLAKYYEFVRAEAYKPFTAGAYLVTPFPARHAAPPEKALIYLIEKDGKTIFYGNDTGIFENDDIAKWLAANGKRIDLLSLDCTKGDEFRGYYSHMSFEEDRSIADTFLKYGVIDKNTLLVATHYSHNCGMIYDELVPAGKKYGFTVAYDGMEVTL